MPSCASRKSRRGFTIVETLVSLVVCGIIAVATYAASGLVIDTRARATKLGSDARFEVAARLTLASWLRSATHLDGRTPFEGVPGGTVRNRSDAMTFGVADGGPLFPGPHLIRLRHNTDRGRPNGVVAELRPLAGSGFAPPETLLLSASAVGFRARYHGIVEGRRQWLDAWKADTVLPRAIAFQLTYEESFTGESGFSTLGLPLVVGVAGREP